MFFSLKQNSYSDNEHTDTSENTDEENALRSDFEDHIRQHVLPETEYFETKRQNLFGYFQVIALLGTLAGALAGYLMWWTSRQNGFNKHEDYEFMLCASVAIPVFLTALGLAWIYITYTKNIKSVIFPKIFSFWKDFTYSESVPGTILDTYHARKILPEYNEVKTEDHVKGHYKNIDLEFFETALYKVKEVRARDDNGHFRNEKRKSRVFKGFAIYMNFMKPFNGTILLNPINSGWFSFDQPIGLEQVELEDPEFNDKFKVLASDQIHVRRLLTPAFMNRLLELQDHIGGKKISASFYDTQVLLLVHTGKNRFEPRSLFKPVDFTDDANMIFEEIRLLTNIIDILKAYQTTSV